MAKFKVGDRVVLVEHGGDTSHKLKIGQQGTVVTIPSTRFAGVSWDGLKTGHSMNGKLSDDSGWGVAVDLLQLVVESELKFKIGDRVVLTTRIHKLPEYATGTVVKLYADKIGVSWDDFANGHSCNGFAAGRSGWNVLEKDIRLLLPEEDSPFVEPPPPAEPAKPKPVKPPKPKPWFAPIESAIDDLLEMSFEFKPASEWLMSNPYETAAAGNWTAPKPQEAASKPQPEPKKETKPKKDGCWKCTAYQQVADCEYGFCTSWHNFAGKDEFCSRFKAVETVDN